METFPYLYGCKLGEYILLQTDNLSHSIQATDMCAADAHEAADAVLSLLLEERTNESFNKFWDEVEEVREMLGIQEGKLPRQRRHPTHLNEC